MDSNQTDLTRRANLALLLGIISSVILSMAVPTRVWGTTIDSATLFSNNGHYYQLFSTLRTWDNARWAAEQMGGYLATITSPAENSFVTSLLPDGFNAWLGGFQPAGSPEPAGNWQWVTGEAFSYVNWNTGEPNNGVGWGVTDESALEIYGITTDQLGKWNDVRPNVETYGYVVEFDSTPPGIPEPEAPPVPDTCGSIGLLCLGLFLIIPTEAWSNKPAH